MTKTQIQKLVKEHRYLEAMDALNSVLAEEETIYSPKEASRFFNRWRYKSQENFLVATLDGSHKLIQVHCVSVGLVNKTLIHPREVFRPAILDNATAVIVAHNHPSGNLKPSQEDNDITDRLVQAGMTLGIQVLDHLIVSREGDYSFCDNGKIKP